MVGSNKNTKIHAIYMYKKNKEVKSNEYTQKHKMTKNHTSLNRDYYMSFKIKLIVFEGATKNTNFFFCLVQQSFFLPFDLFKEIDLHRKNTAISFT